MKKLLGSLLLLMILLNVAVLLRHSDAAATGNKTTLLKISKIDLNEVKPGILPGLLKF